LRLLRRLRLLAMGIKVTECCYLCPEFDKY
jgi:hypothetical protein